MCGIAGFYGFKNDELIKKISHELAHRGPDGEGFYFDEEVTLLNRRLAIIDLEGGNQPIFSEDKKIAVVQNGEIYNFRELRKVLEKGGHKFSTHSDTEVIVHAYEEWGEACFDKFNGMFAIAIRDQKENKLILARDHFGIKPLYYSIFATCRLVFSSEIKPIINSGLIKKKPNDRIIYRYLKYRIHDDTKETFFKGVYKLMPGEMMIIQNSKIKIKNFSHLKDDLLKSKESKVTPQKVADFKKELTKAVKYRLISDVPVGTCLSGGLDSSTIVAMVNKLLKENNQEVKSVGKIQNSFSAVFPSSSNDESVYIDALIGKIKNIKSHKIYPKPEEFFEELDDFVKTQEEPTISTGPYAQYKVMEEATRDVKVLMDGQGSDEMMAGYLPYYFIYLRQLFRKKQYSRFLKEVYYSLDIIGRYLYQKFLLKIGIKENVNTELLFNSKFSQLYQKEKFKVTDDDLKARLIEDIFSNSLPSLLRYEDRNSMRFSIEGRVPFLDVGLLSLIFSLSDDAIIKNGWNKKILREAVTDLLPEMIVKRRNKIGFTTPEQEWFMRMKNKIYSIFLSESFSKRIYFNQKEVLRSFEHFIEGKNDDTMLFWRILNLEMWLRIFFDEINEENKNQKKVNPEINVNGKIYLRYPIKTSLFQKGDNYVKKITDSVFQARNKLKDNRQWFVVVSEKVVAIAQGRSYFIWDIKPSPVAKLLANYVKKTPYGIGLGSPWTMQLAINEVGLAKILLAAFVSAVTKPFGLKGVFYQIAGREVAAIDGPTEYSLYPSNVSAKLGPKDPEKAAEEIHGCLNSKFDPPAGRAGIRNSKFLGVAIIDANDLGRNVLGNTTNLDNRLIEKIFSDNPMGQADEQTPLTVVSA